MSCPSNPAQRFRALSTTVGEKACVIAAIPSTSDQSRFPIRVCRVPPGVEGNLRVAVGDSLGVGLGLTLGLELIRRLRGLSAAASDADGPESSESASLSERTAAFLVF